MTTYEVWAEGYRASPDSGPAEYLGAAVAESFVEAVKIVAAKSAGANRSLFNFENTPPTFWGLQTFL